MSANWNRLISSLCLIAIVLVVGCAANTQKTSTPPKTISSLERPIYGLLKNTASGYVFAAYRTGKPVAREPWVNLAVGKPTWPTGNSRCERGLLLGERECSVVARQDLFMESNFDEGNAAWRVATAPLTLGLTLTSTSYDVKFNERKFDEAYGQALSNVDVASLVEISRQLGLLDDRARQVANGYKAAISRAKQTISYEVDDKSGLYRGEIVFGDLVRLSANELSRIESVEATSISQLELEFSGMQVRVSESWQHAASAVKLECETQSKLGFILHMECPRELPVVSGEVRGGIRVLVKARDVQRVLPRTFELHDKQMSLSFDGTSVGLSNLSGSFITVDSIAFYYKGKIAQRHALKLELAPNAELLPNNRIRIDSFPIEWQRLAFNGLTKGEAQRTLMSFGFAIKYRVVETNREQTLYAEKKYTLYELIG